jgi:predicted  nucleic acid-binding Zn-ribbon protein
VSLEELEQLLAIQERDTALDRLRHRRETLPERAELETQFAHARALTAKRAEVKQRRDAVHAEEQRFDDEARTVEQHAADVDKKLYSGATTSPRELQAMQADLEMLRRQLSELEDQELEVMEQREALDAELEQLDREIGTVANEMENLQATIAGSEAEIDAEVANEEQARAGLAASVGDALLRDYERRRTQNKGAGAARLVGNTCQACHLSIPSTEAERIHRGEGAEIAYCDNCGAILVP